MDLDRTGPLTPKGPARRTVLHGLLSSGLAAGAAGLRGPSAFAAPDPTGAPLDWNAFDRAARQGFDRMGLVGAAVAVVSSDRVLHTLTLGSRSLRPRRPVTEDTHFLVASVTKSMTAALVATYVDQGVLGWEQPVIDAWSSFRGPTDELTRTLRVRDMLGMGTGIGAPPATDFHQGEPTAAQLVQSLVTMPVIDKPGHTFFYNNAVYATGGYLPLLATGVAPADLTAAYGRAMQDRVFGPAGMTGARIASDPRGVVDDYATGYGFDLRPTATFLPYAPVGSFAPIGGALANLSDAAAWARLQLRNGVSVNGSRVVSAANLAQCWAPGVTLPIDPALDPDAVHGSYALGWFREELRDGSTVLQHGGNIDGFTSMVAFLPQHDLGLVVLNAMDSSTFGSYLLHVMVNLTLGLDRDVPDKILHLADSSLTELAQLGRTARDVDFPAVGPYLGYYESGYSLVREGRDLQLRLGPRVWPLRSMPDGSYIVTAGPPLRTKVHLALDADGTPHVELEGLETVRRTTGPA